MALAPKSKTSPDSPRWGRPVCNSCHDLDLTSIEHKWHDVESFSKSARNGCDFCGLISRAVSAFPNLWDGVDHSDDTDQPVIKLRFHRFEKSNTSQLVLGRFVGSNVTNRKTLGLYTPGIKRYEFPIGMGHSLGFVDVAPHISLDTGSPGTIVTLQKWIGACINHHSCGAGSPQSVSLPHRVLNLRDDEVRLQETYGLRGTYTALSWCWGDSKPPMLKMANLSQLKRHIPLSTLPSTFKDAILLTRKLGIQYLWIDSLCIIQNSTADWEEQAGVMTDVYRNAFLTISAAASKNAEEGLFRKVNSKTVGPIRLKGSATLTQNEDIFVRMEGFHNPLYAAGNWYQLLQNWLPLLSRGWAFQEYLLSTRVVFFTQVEVVFENARMGVNPFPAKKRSSNR